MDNTSNQAGGSAGNQSTDGHQSTEQSQADGLQKLIDAKFAAMFSKFESVLAERDKKLEDLESKLEAAKSKAEDKTKSKSEDARDVSPMELKMRELEAQLAEQRKAAEAAEKKREETERAARLDAAQRAALDALATKFPGEAARNAMARLVYEGRLDLEGDAPAITFQRTGYTEKLPLAQAVEEFAKTDLGKSFLPPIQAAGTGASPRGGSSAGGSSSGKSLAERLQAALGGTPS